MGGALAGDAARWPDGYQQPAVPVQQWPPPQHHYYRYSSHTTVADSTWAIGLELNSQIAVPMQYYETAPELQFGCHVAIEFQSVCLEPSSLLTARRCTLTIW
jgi:hypothetical protein